MRLRTCLLASACAFGALLVPVHAQTAGSSESSEAASNLEMITVTARKVEENLQDTPLSVTALTGQTLERRQLITTLGLADVTPSFEIAPVSPLTGNNNAAQVFIRGIGQTDATAGVDPGVGIYIDDVYMGSAVGGVMDFHDIANVQILRGPQGTLFGRNTIGGAVLLTTTDPGTEVGGTARAGVGTGSLFNGQFAIDIPIVDGLLSRWTFGKRTQDGYVTRLSDGRDLGNVNTMTATGKLVWTPREGWRFKLQGDFTHARENGAPLVFAAINTTAAFPRAVSFNAGCPGMTSVGSAVPENNDPRCANNHWNAGPFANNGTFPVRSNLDNWGISLVGEIPVIEHVSVKSITAYRHLAWAGSRDADNTPFPILHTNYNSRGWQFSQELQGIYTSDLLTGVVGLFYYNQYTHDILTVTLAPPPSPTGTNDSNNAEVKDDNWAAFTQWTWNIVAGLSATGGVRYTHERKQLRPDEFNYSNPSVMYVPYAWFSRDFNATTGSASLQYRWAPELMTYVSWSQGFKSGGFNSRFNGVVPGGPPPFDPESANSYEAGAKLDLFGNLRIDTDFFRTYYANLQFTYRVGTAPFLFNAGKAIIQGWELETTWVPTSRLTIEGGLSLLNNAITQVSSIVGASTSVTTASKLPYTPNFQGNIGVSYDFDVSSGWTLSPRADLIYTTHQWFDAGDTPQIAQLHPIMRLNLAATLQNTSAGWSLQAGLTNATDRVYPIAGNSSLTTSSGYAEVAYDRGREWRITLTKNF